ncbi:MAG: substrate-binding domain-containing protein [Bacillota bacterium]
MQNNKMAIICKKIIAVSLILCVVFITLAGCSSQSSGNDTTKVMFIPKSQELSFWEITIEGFNTAIAEYNAEGEVRSTDNEEDVEGQIAIVRSAIEEGFDAIVISAISYEELASVVDEASSAGLEVVVIDSDVNSESVKARISTDNYVAGFLMGEEMASQLGYKGTVATLEFDTETQNGLDRTNGFLDAIAQYPNMNVIRKEVLSNTYISKLATLDLLYVYPEIEGMVSMNELITVGLGEGVEESGRTDICCIGFDNNAIVVDYIEKGIFHGTIVQNQFAMGYLGAETAIKLVTGEEKNPSDVDTGATLVTKDNMYDSEIQSLLFPFDIS